MRPRPFTCCSRLCANIPDYAFGTIFVKGDFPHELVPEDFPANRATDHLAEAGNFYIAFECGERDEDEEDGWWESTAETDIFELLNKVREHPDYVFGTIFVPGDFPGNIVPEDFSGRWGEDTLAQAGNEYIYDIVGDADDDDGEDDDDRGE